MDETHDRTTTSTTTTTMIHFARSDHFYSSRQHELTSIAAAATASDSRMDHPKSSSTITAAPTSGFFKFLARFSGRRRISYRIRRLSSLFFPFVAIFLVLSTVSRVTDACSSRTTPKPRPPSPTPRPNITFHTYKCPPAYAAWYCLNDATCFTVKIGDSLLYNCECADGYMGPRCEYKDLDGSYLPTRPRVMLETASIASGAIVAVVLATIVCCYICVHKHQQKKRLELELATNGGVDTVDGAAVLRAVRSDQPKRPFGSHHLRTIPMSESLKR